jgi:ABC-2 type transport system permease protein
MMASVMPLMSPEKGEQVTFIFGSVLLLISGVYYPVDVLPGWMQALATVSPVTYALEGARAALLDGEGITSLWSSIWPLLIIGAICVPLGLWIFHLGERYAKRTGRLKRSG